MCCVIDGNCVNSSFNATFIEAHTSEAVQQRRQYIYPDINFTCNGTITKWIYGARNKTGVMLPELQIWRPLSNHYIKVGSSSVTADTSIDTNLYEFIPQIPLEFQEGDIFGIHIPLWRNNSLLLYEQRGNGPLNSRVRGGIDTPLSKINATSLRRDNSDFLFVTAVIQNATTNSTFNNFITKSVTQQIYDTTSTNIIPTSNVTTTGGMTTIVDASVPLMVSTQYTIQTSTSTAAVTTANSTANNLITKSVTQIYTTNIPIPSTTITPQATDQGQVIGGVISVLVIVLIVGTVGIVICVAVYWKKRRYTIALLSSKHNDDQIIPNQYYQHVENDPFSDSIKLTNPVYSGKSTNTNFTKYTS